MNSPRVAIVGGGISGLAAAHYLERQAIPYVLVEKSARLGGLIRTERVEDCLLEAGPDSFLAAKPAVSELASEVAGLKDAIISSNDAARRVFIVRNDKLVAFPRGMSMMVPGEMEPALASPLFSDDTKARIASEHSTRPLVREGDFSVGDLVRDHFGEELLAYVAEPLLSGVYGGSAARLSARSVLPRFVEYEERLGSLIRGVQQEKKTAVTGSLFQSFANGMAQLTDALPPVAAMTNGEVVAVERAGAARWRIRLADESMECEHVLLACPAHRAAPIVQNAAPDLAAELGAIPYSSAVLVTFLYRESDVASPLDGFGFLVPQRERQTIAAATWINRKFPTRIAAGWIAIRGFVVGGEAVALQDASDDEMVVLVQKDLRRLMGIDAAPYTSLVYRWPLSMPQYVVGHAERVERIRSRVAELGNLHLIGNAYEGVGIPDCIRLAKVAADAIATTLKAPNYIKSA